MKKALLAAFSLLTLGLLIGGAVHESFFSEWRHWQAEYEKTLLRKTGDTGGFEVKLRQIVIPGLGELGTVDRCVSCHVGIDDPRMADAPQPFTAHPGDLLAQHDMDKFGCTSCHGGQGRALTKEKAHESLRMPPFTQSSCGVCHDPAHVKETGAPVLARGLELFQTSGCLSCHKLGARGGTLGPSLQREGDRVRHDFPFEHLTGEKTIIHWQEEHLKDPQKVVPNSKMLKMKGSDEDIAAVTAYLLSLKKAHLEDRFIPRDKYQELGDPWYLKPMTGEQLYRNYCVSCHGEGKEGEVHESIGRMIPALRNADFLSIASDDFLFKNIRDGRPGTEMIAWGESGGGLTDGEIRTLIGYLKEGITEKAPSFVPLPQADAARGKDFFIKDCVKCHLTETKDGAIGDATWLGSPGFQNTYSDAQIGQTIKYSREGSIMDPYGTEQGGDLTDQDITDVIAFIRTIR